MRVIALLSLLFGFMGLLFLDGQIFTHAVVGIICGIAAVASGLASARKDYADEGRRWLGRILAGMGVVLALFCVVRLPSGYRFQTRFNERSKKAREMMDATNNADAEVRKNLPGKWMLNGTNSTGSFESTWTINPNGWSVGQVVSSNFSDGILRTQDMSGRIEVGNGVLIETITRHSQTNAQLPMISRFRIVRLNAGELVLNEWADKSGEFLTNEIVFRRGIK
jgi:hypothetical protein